MKLSSSLKVLAGVVVAGAFLTGNGLRAQITKDDVKWINQCIADNKDEGQTRAVLVAYCTCMNNEMSSSETKSITEWEKTHKKEAEACSKKAGWK